MNVAAITTTGICTYTYRCTYTNYLMSRIRVKFGVRVRVRVLGIVYSHKSQKLTRKG